jgi:MFS family permease
MTPNLGWLTTLKSIPRGVWTLGLVSLFMDISSEMIHALLPLYLVTVLGTSALTVGLIEGIAEATAMLSKIFSGALSDWLGRRKLLAAIGYGLAAFSKPLFPLAAGVGWIVAARFVDRVGKGIRGAPRDALIADLTPEHVRGASFGLRQSLDTVGAFVGPLLAIALMVLTADSFVAVFWIAVVPAFISFALIAYGVEEPARQRSKDSEHRLRISDYARFGLAYWAVVAVATVLTLARFSEAFLVLKAQHVGLPIALVPGVMVVMNIAYALSAYPAGALSDSIGRGRVIAAGLLALIVADVMLALGGTTVWLGMGVIMWGLHMGLTQGLLASLVTDTSPEDLRGTAFGIFNFAGGVAMLAASLVAGALWDAYGPAMTFLCGGAFTVLGLAGLGVVHRIPGHASPDARTEA